MTELHPEHARAVLEHLACGVVVLDGAGRVVWINAHAVSLLDQPAASVVGRYATDLGLPYIHCGTPSPAPAVDARGSLIGCTQPYAQAHGEGSVMLVCGRNHPLVSYVAGLAGLVASSTRLLSRAAIANRLDLEISRSRRYANELSCIAVRLCGPSTAADLATLARELKHGLRWVDVLGQWQDDALLLVLPETDVAAAERLRDKLVQAVAAPAPGLALEWGVSAWRRGESVEQVVERGLAQARPMATERAAQRPVETASTSS